MTTPEDVLSAAQALGNRRSAEYWRGALDVLRFRMLGAQIQCPYREGSSQFDAYFDEGLWLDSARHANAMSTRLARAFGASNRARLAWETEANEVFADMGRGDHARLSEAGARFYEWQPPLGFSGEIGPDDRLYRFVTSFATTTEDVDRFAELLG